MPEASGFVRAECRQALKDLIEDEVSFGVTVLRNEPREFSDIMIWLSDTIGSVDYPASATNLPRDDVFTIVVVCRAYEPGDEADEAETRVQELANNVMSAVSTDPTVAYSPLGGLVEGVIQAIVASVDGPDCFPGPEGYEAVMLVSIEIQTRIVNP
jgi:hypothetical protein